MSEPVLPALLQDREALHQGFIRGLAEMLEAPTPGAFVLVLANAAYDPRVREALWGRLQGRFAVLAAEVRETLRAGRPLRHPPDDLLVFLKLMAVGIEGLGGIRRREAGPWELQFNPLRGLRPPRMSDAVVNALSHPFAPEAFHFDRPFLRPEILWEGVLLGRHTRLLYNKFPFADLHALLVLEPAAGRPQLLTREAHLQVWRLLEALGPHLPGVGLGYNAYGAYASVNHQHFQLFVRRQGAYPLEAGAWRHNGGDAAYPLPCRRFEAPEAAWEAIAALHLADRASYNLLYRPGTAYLLPRLRQGAYAHAPWTGGFAWSEVAGAFTTFNRDDLEALEADAILAEFRKMLP